MYRKNVASQNLPFALVNATTGAALTGATVTARRSLDGGAQASATGSVSELGNGQYNLALSQADTNGNQVGVLLTATNAVPVHFTLVTTAANPTDANLGLTNLDAAVSTRASQTSVDDLPTNAELATSQAAADDATLAAIAALNNLSSAQAQTAAAAALTAYDPPTHAELTAEINDVQADVATRASQVSVDDLPTNAELATSQAAADDATLAAIAALNNLSSAQAQAAAAAALTAYDGPTHAEMTAELATADDATLAAIAALSTSTDDLPTNAELSAALAAADDAVLAAIAGLPAAPSAAAIVAALLAQALTELGIGEPPDSPTVNQALMLPYQMLAQGGLMNATTGESTYRNGAGVTFCKRVLSDDGTTMTEGKLVTP